MDRFDGIVFGELAARKWMAGSEHYVRTAADQSTLADENAQPNQLIQVAIVYQGKQAKLYRNGQLISEHQMPSEPIEFGPTASIVIGKRHSNQAGESRIAGKIDDVRIYDIALTQEQIVALKPNAIVDRKPWAWWNFNKSDSKEETGRFLISQLQGNARIENGMLVLDGMSANFVAKSGRTIPVRIETPTRPAEVPSNWLTFHLAHPGPGTAMPGDPNCAFYWKGRYHLHYIYKNDDGFVFAHVSSDDLLHWKWHPTTLTPSKTGHGMFSGTGFFTKDGRPAIIYHGQGSGRNQIAIAQDDNLEKWSDPMPIEPIVEPGQDGTKIANWDPDCWIDGDNYYALSGGSPGSGKPPTLFRSNDLKQWKYLELFLTKDMPNVKGDEDISCPNFFKIGNKDMLLCISHTLGCRYYLGEWKNEKFTPDFHARMNWNAWDFFAPESLVTADGRRVMWAWCNLGEPQSGIQSLPRELSLPEDGILRIKPLKELESLRSEMIFDKSTKVLSNEVASFGAVGHAAEIEFTCKAFTTGEVSLVLHADAKGQSGYSIKVIPQRKILMLGEMEVPFDMVNDELLKMRVFIDQNVIEVFVNDRQAAVASHKTIDANTYVAVTAADTSLEASVKAWKLKSIYAK